MDFLKWNSGGSCEQHGMPWCSNCKPDSRFPKLVWITEGWSNAFHLSPTCEYLVAGQKLVESRGGNPAPVIQVQLGRAKDKEPCQKCFPPPRS